MSAAAVSHVRGTHQTGVGGTNGGASSSQYNSRNLYHHRPVTSSNHHPPPQTSSARGDWTLEQFVDKKSGQSKEIVVLADTPSPGPEAGPSRNAANVATTNGRPIFANEAGPASKRTKVANGDAYAGYAQANGYTGASGSGIGADSKAFAKGKRKLDTFVSGQQKEADAKKQKEAPPPWDDKEGHYIVQQNDILDNRYRVVKLLGQGTFGKVVHAIDTKSSTDPRTGKKREVAVKVIRAVQKYRDASRVEIKVLNLLRDRDPNNINKCIHLLDCFDFRNHICIVSELLSQSVFDFLKENQYSPFPPSHIQSFAKQLLSSVAFLHELRLVHTDLKPENILLVDSASRVIPSKSTRGSNKTRKVLRNSDIRLIDFGSATFEEEYHASVVSTRHYRAPEIILGFGWSYPCDVWSIGCILIEFFTGEALFQTHENLEHLAMMQCVFGNMPDNLMRKASKTKGEFIRNGRLDYPQSTTTRQSRKFVKAMKKLEDIVPESTIINARFKNLLEKLLHWDPNKRITVREALKHSYFSLRIEDESTALRDDAGTGTGPAQ